MHALLLLLSPFHRRCVTPAPVLLNSPACRTCCLPACCSLCAHEEAGVPWLEPDVNLQGVVVHARAAFKGVDKTPEKEECQHYACSIHTKSQQAAPARRNGRHASLLLSCGKRQNRFLTQQKEESTRCPIWSLIRTHKHGRCARRLAIPISLAPNTPCCSCGTR